MIAKFEDIYNNFIVHVLKKKNIILFTSRDCNFKCAHCVQGQGGSRDAELMPQRVIDKVIDQLDSSYFVCICGGECMLHIDQVEYVIRKAQSKRIKTMIGTNGFWWNNEKLLTKIKELQPTILRLSVDTFHQQFVSLENIMKLVHYYDSTPILCYAGSILSNECSKEDRQLFDSCGLLYEVMSCVYSGNAQFIQQRERLKPNKLVICEACGVVITPDGSLHCECELEAGGCDIGHIDTTSFKSIEQNFNMERPWHLVKQGEDIHDIYELCRANNWHVFQNWNSKPLPKQYMDLKPLSNAYGHTLREIMGYFSQHFENIGTA
jgi:organic radical activating enzyme